MLIKKAFERLLKMRASYSLNLESKSTLTRDASDYWNASKSSGIIRDLSHWVREGRWGDEQAWHNIGRHHQGMHANLNILAKRTTPVRSMLEWGSGGGANAVTFSQEIPLFYGVDISSANLEECGRQLSNNNYVGFHPILIEIDKPESCLKVVKSPVDFFLSTAVFQHFPSKSYGERVTRIAFQLLAAVSQ